MSRKVNSDTQFLRALLLLCFILFAASVRILPHPWNFTPIGAMALFSGAKLNSRWAASLIPLSALFLGDLFVGIYKLMIVVYLSFCLSVLIGRYVRRQQSLLPVSLATLLGAVQFFLITNFAVWAFGYTSYARSLAGLLTCYIAGIPLFFNTLLGDAFYAGILFGGFELVERLSPALRTSETHIPG
jgi:hypothetical protein